MKLIPLAGRGNEYLFNPVDSKVIWVSRSKKGFGRRQRSLFTENPIEARTKRDEMFANWLGEKPIVAKKVKQLNDDHWKIWRQTKERKRKATKDSIDNSAKHLLPMIGSLYPEEITESWWENTYIPQKREAAPERKFYNDWKWLTTYLNFLHRAGTLPVKPKLICPDGETEEGLNLDDSEIEALYEFSNEDLRLQIDLGFKHFMRRSEVLLSAWTEINFETGVLTLPPERTKTKKERKIPLAEETLLILYDRKQRSESPYVFPSPEDKSKPVGRTGNNTAWKRAIARANAETQRVNPKATFHDLRHSGLSRAFVATNRYIEICVVGGLSLEQAQETYLHLKPEHTRFVSGLVTVGRAA